MLATIRIDMIDEGQRLRGLNEAQVSSLVASIRDVGLLNPITVYPRKLYHSGNQVDGYGLVAGLHRKAACERLGLAEIAANVVEIGDLERQIAECDENLCGPVLSPSDRARFTRRRKEAYEALHPETRHGGDRKSDQVAESATRSFADDQSEKTGAAPRTVRLDAERGEKVCDEALDLVRGTKLDTGSYLDRLKRLSPDEQVVAVKRDADPQAPVNDDEVSAYVAAAEAFKEHVDAEMAAVDSLVSHWMTASVEVRGEFLRRIGAAYVDPK